MNTFVVDESKVLGYDPETGQFVWLTARGNKPAGAMAGTVRKDGYRRIHFEGKQEYAHRVAWKLMTGKWPDEHIDHINGDPSDNRFANLRPATASQNLCNRKTQSNNSSGFKGVSWSRASKKWAAYICVQKKKKHLGFFIAPEDAFDAYCKAAKTHFGEFANLESL